MKRLLALFFALAGVIYSSSTLAAVCFLADTECQEGKFAVDKTAPCRDQNSSWYHESQLCKGLVYGNVLCNDATGNYYEEGTCPSGYTDFRTVDTTKYKCGDSSLLCDRCCKNVVCLDKYHECKYNSVPKYPSDVCVEPADGTKKYTECECHDPYKETCTGTGITNGTGGYCVDDEGKRFYKDCQCSSGYTEVSLSDIKCPSRCEYDCLNLGTKVQLPGSNSKYCWTGAECKPKPEPQCTISYQSDFDNFWQGYDAATDCTNLTVDCNTLGYDTGSAETGVKCKDGSEPYRCPFDHAMVYCESGIEDTGDTCTYTTASECETYYFGSLCRADSNGCYNPYACATGYGKTIKECSGGKAGNWSLGGYDAFGCSECKCTRVCDNEYTGSLSDNAEWVSGSCDSCGITTTVHIGWKCKTGYQKNVAGTGCILSTCPTGYAKAADDCYNKGSAGWSLDLTDKYDSTDCYKCTAKSCEAGYSTDITSIADCGTTGSAGYTFTKSESGYSGDDACGKCECTDPCKDTYTGEIPENAHAVTEACKACDEEKDIVTDWACDDGYIINSAKTGCIPATCPVGYAKVASECSASGSGAWHLDMNNRYDSTDCYKCEPDACKGESSTTITINQCGSADIGSAGWSLEETGASGEDKCYTCKKLACKPGYSTETTTCEAGYELVTQDYSGDDACGKCVEKDCSTGYSKSITSEANCSAGYEFEQEPGNPLCGKCKVKPCETGYSTETTTCEAGYELVTKDYSGDDACGKCVEKDCSAGYSKSITSEANCSAGYEFEQEPDNPLCGKCEEKSCPDGYSKDIKSVADCGNGSVGAAGWIFSSSNGCGKCTERPCSGNVHHTSIDKCGIGGAEGWNFSACYYGDHILGTCTAKTCKDHHMQDVRTDIGLLCKAKQVYLGNTKTDCYDCVACEDAGLSGAIFTRINDCSAICPLTGYSSTTMIYNSARTAILHDAEGRYGVCYAWNAVSCSSSSHFGDCYCKYGTSVSSCN